MICPAGKAGHVLLRSCIWSTQNPLRENCDLVRHFNVIWVVQPAAQKYVAFRPFKSVARLRHPDPTRGADRASSRTRDGMRWTRGRQARCVFAGRFSVSEHWPRKTNGAEAYGKTVWSRHPLLVPSCAEVCEARPGFHEPLIRRRRRQDEFVSWESAA